MNAYKNQRLLSILEISFVIIFAVIPLFVSFPFRLNIFLSWDGAYRISQGQMPYKDFGLPLGYGYWLIPALFFKMFGPDMITLIKAQVFINIMSGFAFISILRSLRVSPLVRLLSVVVYILSFSFFNFWPWYNHTVIVYEFVALALLFKYLLPKDNTQPKIIWLPLASLFLFLSFFTKQDGGGLGLLLCLALLAYYCWLHKTAKPVLVFLASYIIIALAFILPVLPHRFGYWFNHGQPPHNSRLSAIDFLSEFLNGSQWIKFYLLLCVVLILPYFKEFKTNIRNERLVFLILLTFGIIAEAAVFQFTSYTPPDNNIFYHSFVFMFIVTILGELKIITFTNLKQVTALAVLVLIWWSQTYWKYIDRKLQRVFNHTVATVSPTGENVVNEKTYQRSLDSSDVPQSAWVFSDVPVFKKLYMPPGTVGGLHRLLNNPAITSKAPNNRILNMTELTPLSYVLKIEPERGSQYPLWYHLGVGMFNEQKNMYLHKIAQKYYDVVLFENIPALNNFYPFEIRDSLKTTYHLIDSFMAPRSPTNGTIEVYVKELQ